ncbi:hypothetical protein MtrunA17_Chr2g0318111 [Medicago truncatula]|uniref:Uncharacterized protein n=1 Tax=Medicago truncatula TaxID=3880 RepID=A0A396JA46_MEDTR|nr:hypothetical protein MtrunA17_Chr2g0318111 [Medicago truncatula]
MVVLLQSYHPLNLPYHVPPVTYVCCFSCRSGTKPNHQATNTHTKS